MTEPTGLRMRRRAKPTQLLLSSSERTKKDAKKRTCESPEFESIVRAEINSAIEESLARNTSQAPTIAQRLKILESEARKMLDSVEAAKVRDDFSRRHNQRMKKRERLLCGVGMLCLVCPALVVFNKVMTLFPKHHVEILQYASQQDSLYGAASRFCLQTVLTARRVSDANLRSGFMYCWGCIGAMAVLLLLVRHATTKHAVLTASQRDQIAKMKVLIEEEMQNTKSCMLATPSKQA